MSSAHFQRERVQKALKRVDPAGVAARGMAIAPIPRKLYGVDGPNALWHIDGNHRLAKYVLSLCDTSFMQERYAVS